MIEFKNEPEWNYNESYQFPKIDFQLRAGLLKGYGFPTLCNGDTIRITFPISIPIVDAGGESTPGIKHVEYSTPEKHSCTCDFHTVIMRHGCQCGGV